MATLKYSRQRESIKEFLMTRKDHIADLDPFLQCP